MSGIEVLTNFFENIRPRYSWSSADTVVTDSHETPVSTSSSVHATNDEVHSDATLASPPASPMHGIETPEYDCGVYTDTEDDDDSQGSYGSSRASGHAIGDLIAAATTSDHVRNVASPHRMPPSESPSNASVSGESLVMDQESPAAFESGYHTTENRAATEDISNPVGLAIPEDDGHRVLREKLLEIQKSSLTERERAQRMHSLMTEKYLKKTGKRPFISPTNSRPRSMVEGDPFSVTEEDKEPSYANDEEGILGCSHYRRNVKLQCSTCEKWYPCRFCHDDKEQHSLIRKDTKNMLCMFCGTAQPAAQTCRQCVRYAATYYCDKCKLWDDDPTRTIYHCNDCGICRIGRGLGKDFFHCKKCGVCMSIELEGQHRCIERSTDCDCPICGEYLFTSINTVVFMTCGHSIHLDCYNEHMKSSYRCPTCAKSVFNMESRFRYLDYEIQRQPLPEPYKYWHCHIICNDCSAKSDVAFHFLGLKCDTCKSYNTCEVKLIRPDEDPNSGADDSMLSRNLLPPPHFMPNPEIAGTIVPGEDVVADLASVIREIERRDIQAGSSTAELANSSDGSECSCGSPEGDDHDEEGDLYDNGSLESGEEYDDDNVDDSSLGEDDDDEEEPVDEGPAPLEIIHLPGHP
ncbi:hypothetical protein H072_9223 [Dactylellina haptotyla CBS 200.50]|uniref:CHY-type domain-containing protein n=1 Tax=Dactylellina haptotyla (strain CBS 200.50) TaxID=1284197 RepID=S8A294_DACHA|nr:hypothetical protein H072_9223 [Dactylellina haptotyla CBS 200.50]